MPREDRSRAPVVQRSRGECVTNRRRRSRRVRALRARRLDHRGGRGAMPLQGDCRWCEQPVEVAGRRRRAAPARHFLSTGFPRECTSAGIPTNLDKIKPREGKLGKSIERRWRRFSSQFRRGPRRGPARSETARRSHREAPATRRPDGLLTEVKRLHPVISCRARRCGGSGCR
jgi:hypothetical protein